ncbi:hypothetical protein DM01DRAFT_1381137 [Hesseltinella vesiculosa]|uniref:WRKY domain-containing protein n=1 Tax=Hesseltinella vesiculosa TaxID=101127 RepID=A0A1X2GR57_9FUNG|nr:hypothetical protein DM01DRAFT_1381137 [Hesseltinella vesiculosa]
MSQSTSHDDHSPSLEAVIQQYGDNAELLQLILSSKVQEDRRRTEEARLRAKEIDLRLQQQQEATSEASSPPASSRPSPPALPAYTASLPLLSTTDAPTTLPPHSLPSIHTTGSAPVGNVSLLTLPPIHTLGHGLEPRPDAPPFTPLPPLTNHDLMNRNTTGPSMILPRPSDPPRCPSEAETAMTRALTSESPGPLPKFISEAIPGCVNKLPLTPSYNTLPTSKRRRREMQSISMIIETKEHPYEDGYSWKNNGNTIHKNTGQRSIYYKCSNGNRGCPVNKTVTFRDNGEYLIKYRGKHLDCCALEMNNQ